MNLIRTVFSRLIRNDFDVEMLTPRLLDDAGIKRTEVRTATDRILESFAPRYAVEMIRER